MQLKVLFGIRTHKGDRIVADFNPRSNRLFQRIFGATIVMKKYDK